MVALAILAVGCAGLSKDCSKTWASNVGSDWVVVQYAFDGRPFHCWKLSNAVVTGTEGGSVDWKDTNHHHLVHITGWENRVQVVNNDYATAAKILGVDANQCDNGVYPAHPAGQ